MISLTQWRTQIFYDRVYDISIGSMDRGNFRKVHEILVITYVESGWKKKNTTKREGERTRSSRNGGYLRDWMEEGPRGGKAAATPNSAPEHRYIDQPTPFGHSAF